MNIKSLTFSGCFQIEATEKRLDELPIGRAHNLPYLYGSFGPTSFAYVLPDNEDDFRRVLSENDVQHEFVSDENAMREIDIPPSHKSKVENPKDRTFELMDPVFKNWTNGRCAILGQQAVEDTFGRKRNWF